MHVRFDFKFPADFLSFFTDDILGAFDTIKFMGKRLLMGECYQIMAQTMI
jgi:hypothetical protein